MAEKRHSFTWKISNFSFLSQNKDEYTRSPVFIAKSLDETSWCLDLYARGDKNSKVEEMTFFLMRNKNCNGPNEIECEYIIEISSTCSRIYSSRTSSHIFRKGSYWGYNFSKGLYTENDLNSFDDVLTIQCHLISKIREPVLRSESIGTSKVNINRCSFKKQIFDFNCLEIIKHSDPKLLISVQALEDDIRIIIRRTRTLKAQYVSFRITLLGVEGLKQDSKLSSQYFEGNDENGTDTWEFPTFLKKSKLQEEREKYLTDNYSFTLLFEVAFSNGTISKTVEDRNLCFSVVDNFSAFKDGVKRLYTEKTQCDVELIVEKEVFTAHKTILSAWSPVFMAMFNRDLVENQYGQVHIPDFEAKTMEFLLEFMYTGTVENLEYDIAMKLILAAEKYKILSLMTECSRFLSSILSTSNVYDVIAIAELIKDNPLKDSTVRFIMRNSKNIFKSDKWKEFIELNKILSSDILCEISMLLADGIK